VRDAPLGVRALSLVSAATLIAIAMLSFATAPAHADPLPALAPDCPACATAAGGARVIDIFGEMNGTPPLQWYATDTPPPAQGWAAQATDDLTTVEEASQVGGASGESVGAGLMGAGADAGFLATSTELVATLGPIGLAAADTGLLIHDGDLLFHAFFGSSAPPEEATLWRWYSYVPFYGTDGTLADSWEGPNLRAAEAAVGDEVMHAQGWLAQWEWGNPITVVPHGHDWPAPSIGTRVDIYDFDSIDDFYWGDHFYYLLARDIPGSVTTYNPNTDQPNYTVPTPALPDRSTAASALNTELAQPEYHTLRRELQHLLDPRCSPDPTSSTVTIPTVLPNETPSDYAQCLSTLGLNANPTATLPDSQADWGTPASDVVNAQPAPGVAVNPGSDVTIYANPDTMPTPTQRESDLAIALLAKNPGVTDRNKLDIARSCLDLEDAATGNADTTGDSGDMSFANCSTMPMFITGNDAQSAGQHDEIALGVPNVNTDPSLTFSDAYGGVDPEWARLTRDVSGKDGTWKDTLQPCSSATPPDAQCDEYPFLSSQQGGGTANPQPNLQYILGTQNGLQGTRLSQFYSAATPTSLGMNGCSITTGTSFLAIPVPTFAGLNTTWACNGRNDS
jgi:hypothetical protein